MFTRLSRKKELVILGLNSGTSADGLDLAAVKLIFNAKKFAIKFLAGKTVSYPPALHDRLNRIIINDISSMDDLIAIDRSLGDFYGLQAARFVRSLKKKHIRIDAIASHGQTVRHLPGKVILNGKKESGTTQLGHPETISARTGLPVVADFRQGDIAAGGEGAPITTKAMWGLFHSPKEPRLLVNIGGIANYFLFPKGKEADKTLAADSGPGNSLLDIIVARYFNKKFDNEGKIAAKGIISKRLLTLLTADKFIQKKYGPSTGRERFGSRFAEKIVEYSLKLGLNKYDILATTAELTAAAIAGTIGKFPKKYDIKKIYLFGGGAKNKYLVKRLEANIPGAKFLNAGKLGYDPDLLEAACYAVMGAWCLRGETGTLKHITGAKHNAIAGKIIQPPSQ